MADREILFEVKEHLGVLSKYPTGWTKELNLISWNGQAPKFDIRDWDPEHERMSRGVTLHAREISKLVELYLNNKNRKVIEEAKAEEAQRWNRNQASKKREEKREEEMQGEDCKGTPLKDEKEMKEEKVEKEGTEEKEEAVYAPPENFSSDVASDNVPF